jgi:hypothetical protein
MSLMLEALFAGAGHGGRTGAAVGTTPKAG